MGTSTVKGVEKRCARCGVWRDSETEFYRNAKTADGRQSWCKQCMKTYRKTVYYPKNRERVIEGVSRWQDENPEKRKAYKRRSWRRSNKAADGEKDDAA